jgi:hypothetical protein
MSITKINADVMDLGDDYTFTGAVGGVGSNVKEMLVLRQDGIARTVSSGTYTPANITAAQTTTVTWTDVTGSSIAYTPPAGTTLVIYEFNFHMQYNICSWKFFIDSDEVVDFRQSTMGSDQNFYFKHIIRIGDGEDTDSARYASWDSAKTLKLQVRWYSGTYVTNLHKIGYWEAGNQNWLVLPSITMTALS